MNRFFKGFLVLWTVMLVIATITEIANPAALEGFGPQWPVYVGVWALTAFVWAIALGKINLKTD